MFICTIITFSVTFSGFLLPVYVAVNTTDGSATTRFATFEPRSVCLLLMMIVENELRLSNPVNCMSLTQAHHVYIFLMTEVTTHYDLALRVYTTGDWYSFNYKIILSLNLITCPEY